MQVKLNAFRGDNRPGDIIDLDYDAATVMIAHGTAFPVDDLEEQLLTAEAGQPPAARVVKGEATLTSASGTDHTP